jgi:peptidoglycan/xylan/chitin deacetylase (PgdA/CDA1 family)
MFHTVPSVNLFRSTIKNIQKIYDFISIETIESYFYNNIELNNCCHICFDDGDRTVYENAFPILKEMNIPATLFVSPKIISEVSNYWFQDLLFLQNLLDDKSIKEVICKSLNIEYNSIKIFEIESILKCLRLKDILYIINNIKRQYNIEIDEQYNINQNQLKELLESEIIKIGAHTMNHPTLSNENYKDAEKEIRESVQKLSKMTNKDITSFAYPNGIAGLDFNEREQLILQKNKIKLAFTTKNNFYNNKINCFNIPRSGFSSIKIEYFFPYVLFKLITIPIWDNIRDLYLLGESQICQRNKIKNLLTMKKTYFNNSQNRVV